MLFCMFELGRWRRAALLSILAISIQAGGCDEATSDTDAATPTDSGVSDASRSDASGIDASVDAAMPVDSGSPRDAAIPVTGGIWINAAEIAALPTSGESWADLESAAMGLWGTADVSDQDNSHDVLTFAGALYAARTGDAATRTRVEVALEAAIGTESGGRTLALGRQLLGYVLAADLIGYRSSTFVAWVSAVRTTDLDGRAGIRTLLDSATTDPSNWGCHARASIIAAARYLGDEAQLVVLADRLRDYVGRSGAGFTFREDWWQASPSNPVGINPVGAMLSGMNVDGVIPDDQRRGGMFAWPPPRENYVWESLQGTVASAHMLERAGYDSWEWESRAILRAVQWLHDEPNYPAEGDDSWMPWRVNAAYGTSFPVSTGRPTGKSVGFTSWTHG